MPLPPLRVPPSGPISANAGPPGPQLPTWSRQLNGGLTVSELLSFGPPISPNPYSFQTVGNNRVVLPVSGLWCCSYGVQFLETVNPGQYQFSPRLNGVTMFQGVSQGNVVATEQVYAGSEFFFNGAEGDLVDIAFEAGPPGSTVNLILGSNIRLSLLIPS